MAGGKASFTNLDTNAVFTVQFNPKEFKLDSSAAWKDSDEFQQEKPLLTFDRGKPSTVALELIFDTTDGGDVGETWVKPLRSFVSVNVEKTEGGKEIKRPPFIRFVWDKFEFDCVVESVSVQYLMFSAGGTPLRAKVSLALKESKLEIIQSSGNAAVTLSAMKSMMSGSGTAKTYVIKDGETLSQVAKKTNSDAKLIAAANNIKDPMQPPPGPVVIPTNALAAIIFEHLNKSEALGNWGDFKPNLNPDSASSDDWSIEKGEFVFELTAEKEITFSSYQGEEVEANEYEQGESAEADNWDIGANQGVEHEYGEENEAQFSEKHGGAVEKNEYSQGDSASSDGWDTGKNEYPQGESASSDGWDTSKNGPAQHKVGAENEAKFSEKHGGEVEKNQISHAAAKDEKMEGAAANTGKGGHSSNSDAGGAAGGKGGHSSDSSAAGAAGGKGGHSSDSSAAGAAGGKGGHSSDSSAGGAASRGDAAAASAANNAGDKGAAASAEPGKPGAAAGKASAASGDKAAGAAGDKAADTAAASAADKSAASGGASAGVTASGGAKPVAGGSNAGAAAVSEKAGENAKAAAPPPETVKGDPTKERSITGRQVNPGDSATTNASRDLSKVVAEAEKVAKDVNKATDEPKKMAAEGQFQADMIAAKAEMHADRIMDKDTEATDKKK